MQTTLNKIKEHSPCENGWKQLLNYLGKTQADDEPLELRTILESNGLDDAIWALRAVKGKHKEIRLFAADCAELVIPIYEKQYPHDSRPRLAIQAAIDYANGLVSEKELAAAWAAARAAWAAAWAAASDAVRAAAWAAWVAASAAARAAMGAVWAASDTAKGAVWAARDALDVGAASDEIKQLLLKYI